MTANPTPLPLEAVTLKPCPWCKSVDLSIISDHVLPDDYWSAQVRCNKCGATGPAPDVWCEEHVAPEEAIAAWNHRIAATSAAEGEAYNRGVNDGVTEIEKTLHRILRTEWKPSNFQDPTAPTVMQMIDIFEARATQAEILVERLREFIDEIHKRTPLGQWIHVQHHPNGDWSVAESDEEKDAIDRARQALDQGAEG